MKPLAHRSGDGREHSLEEHLKNTVAFASEFASEFGAGEWAKLAGLWHDLGKFGLKN